MRVEDKALEERYVRDEDTGWMEVVGAAGIGSGISYRKKNGVVYIQCLSSGINREDIAQTWALDYPDALPVGYRPNQDIASPFFYWTDGPKLGYIHVSPLGVIRLTMSPQDIPEGWGLIYPQMTLSYPV